MTDALDEAALSGALFKDNYRPQERSGTPEPDSDDSSSEPDSDDIPLNKGGGASTTGLIEEDEIHAQGAQTGIKGVLNDKKAHTRTTNSARQKEREELKGRMEKMSIVANTWSEEEALRAKEQDGEDGVEGWRKARMEELKAKKGLREVGKEGFVHAVERNGWVVVLIYEPEIPRCQTLLQEMTTLSTSLSSSHSNPITLLRARATTLHFSLLTSANPKSHSGQDDHEDDEDEEEEEVEADPDVLPTILAYKDGELERNWIRVDWEIGDGSLEGLLRREGILPEEGFDDRVPT